MNNPKPRKRTVSPSLNTLNTLLHGEIDPAILTATGGLLVKFATPEDTNLVNSFAAQVMKQTHNAKIENLFDLKIGDHPKIPFNIPFWIFLWAVKSMNAFEGQIDKDLMQQMKKGWDPFVHAMAEHVGLPRNTHKTFDENGNGLN